MDWDVNFAIQSLRSAAAGRKSSGDCARFTREAIEAGFVNQCVAFPRPHPVAGRRRAMDYGPSLQAVGFILLAGMCGGFQAGDVAIVDGFGNGKHEPGHMAMFDGKRWISDFEQNNYVGREGGVYPGSAYQLGKPGYRFYRYRGL
ncbi:MAG: CHAP domain-containing protein [Thermoanaerobaculia bacterium]